jgi:hypothetical protein
MPCGYLTEAQLVQDSACLDCVPVTCLCADQQGPAAMFAGDWCSACAAGSGPGHFWCDLCPIKGLQSALWLWPDCRTVWLPGTVSVLSPDLCAEDNEVSTAMAVGLQPSHTPPACRGRGMCSCLIACCSPTAWVQPPWTDGPVARGWPCMVQGMRLYEPARNAPPGVS